MNEFLISICFAMLSLIMFDFCSFNAYWFVQVALLFHSVWIQSINDKIHLFYTCTEHFCECITNGNETANRPGIWCERCFPVEMLSNVSLRIMCVCVCWCVCVQPIFFSTSPWMESFNGIWLYIHVKIQCEEHLLCSGWVIMHNFFFRWKWKWNNKTNGRIIPLKRRQPYCIEFAFSE